MPTCRKHNIKYATYGDCPECFKSLPEGATTLLEIPLPVACDELVKITDKLIKIHGSRCKMTMQQVGDKLRICKPNTDSANQP